MEEVVRMEDKQILETIHILIHSLRLVPKYSPSLAEIKIAKLIVDKYKATCEECRIVAERPPVAPKNFLSRIGDAISGGPQ